MLAFTKMLEKHTHHILHTTSQKIFYATHIGFIMSPHNRLTEQQKHNQPLNFTCFLEANCIGFISPGVVKAYGILSEYTVQYRMDNWGPKSTSLCVPQHLFRGHLTLQLFLPSKQRINTDNGEWFKFPSPQCHSPARRGPTQRTRGQPHRRRWLCSAEPWPRFGGLVRTHCI